MRNKRAFTLMEILITLIILGVVAGLAVPAYFNTVEEGRKNEARVNLSIIRMGEKIFASNDPAGKFWNGGANPCAVVGNGPTACTAINTALGVDISVQYYNITSITAANAVIPHTVQIVATRNTVAGGTGATVCTMDQDGQLTGC